MPWWWIAYAVILIISTALQIALRPKNNAPKLLPGTLDNIPIAEQGARIPVLLGRGYLRQPNVVWYGRAHAEPIKYSGGGASS